MSSSPEGTRWGIPSTRSSLGWAAAAWVGAAIGLAVGDWRPAVLPAAASVVAAGRHRRTAIMVGVVAAGILSGAGAAMRAEAMLTAELPSGRVRIEAVVAMDPQPSLRGPSVVVSSRRVVGDGAPFPSGVVLVVDAGELPRLEAGDTVHIAGRLVDRPGRLGRHRYRGSLADAEVTVTAPASGVFFGPGNRLRRAVLGGLGSEHATAPGGLLAGFLVGDTSRIPDGRLDDLRRAGLTHFVAVSGSNVALFLAAWWLLMGPFELDPRLRAATGLVALGAFVVATRWEPSVVRAATMAAIVLGGRLAGIPVDPWRALGTAVTALLLVSGDLAVDVGFQLSVAATIGVMLGVRHVPDRRPRWVWTVLCATGGAQIAVLPILLWRFGSVPLLSPVANLVAAPLVGVATATGGVGVLTGLEPVRAIGLWSAGIVLWVAEHSAQWPQVGVLGGVAAIAMVAALRFHGLRPAVVLAAATLALVGSMPAAAPPVPTVTFIDVGQGDAVVVRDPSGATALFDGGRDPAVLAAGLRRLAIDRLDVVAVSHGDADHAGGLAGLAAAIPIGELWYPDHQDSSGLIGPLLAEATAHGVPVRSVRAGDSTVLGLLTIRVLGPARRYAADNDGSVVLLVESTSATALLTGDVESVAQRELPQVRPHLLQVPHHGSGTTDPRWLAATVGAVAVVSVGPNPYGHPAPHIIDTLEAAGARVLSTRDHGDVTVALCRGDCP